MSNKNSDLKVASKNKNDEFYTQLSDIENELKYYREYFKGKTVFCNCDDPFESNFFKYFAMNFNFLGLKKLITTCYSGSPIITKQLSLFDIDGLIINKRNNKQPYKIEISEVIDENGDGAVDLCDIKTLLKTRKNVLTLLKENGDFRSEECKKILENVDIVVTNPPFSLFREYVSQLEEYNKQFIIMGNTNALTYKEIFKLFKENRIRTGYTNFNVGMYFYVPEETTKYHKIVDGRKMVRVSTSCWFTNLPVRKNNDKLILYRQYDSEYYPFYVNYDAINVNSYKEIPNNYYGFMGVPITFLDKYNPKQFKIEALGIVGSCTFKNERKMEILDKFGKPTGKYTINAKGTLYKKFNPKYDKIPAFKDCKTEELYSSIYARVIIQRIDNEEGDN